ncbi:hypothetical protein [Paenibacillus sp. FSL E2-0178]|uniref:hypothetical protein n=1 Tax=Paenibacillus sp. FSL E2-0178 TaxID=2921361 RepID=UPI0031598B16
MKRIKYACLEQTIHFHLKDDVTSTAGIAELKEELNAYKATLERKRIKYKVVEESSQPDGSIILKIKKQYNTYDCGDYLVV